jgi:hypothetical protein
VWTGDGRPDDNTAKFSKGVDVFVTELQPDTMNIQALKFGIPTILGTATIVQAGAAAPRDGHAPGLRRGDGPGNGGGHPHALGRPVPVRRAGWGDCQCHKESHLDPQGQATA